MSVTDITKKVRWSHLVLAVLVVLHLAGARAATGALAGIAPDPWQALLGVAYALSWFATVFVVVPIWLAALGSRLVSLAAGPRRSVRPR